MVVVSELLNLAYFVQGVSAPVESSAFVEELGRTVLSEIQKQEWVMWEATGDGHCPCVVVNNTGLVPPQSDLKLYSLLILKASCTTD